MIQDIVENHAIDIDGVGRVHACGKPGNPLVILLHGFMQTGASWAQIAQLLEGYHVLAPDLLGQGKIPFSREDELSHRGVCRTGEYAWLLGQERTI